VVVVGNEMLQIQQRQVVCWEI